MFTSRCCTCFRVTTAPGTRTSIPGRTGSIASTTSALEASSGRHSIAVSRNTVHQFAVPRQHVRGQGESDFKSGKHLVTLA
jgi:hypothetical protein